MKQTRIGMHRDIEVQEYNGFHLCRHVMWETTSKSAAKRFYCAYCEKMGFSILLEGGKIHPEDRNILLKAEYEIAGSEQRLKIMSIILGGRNEYKIIR